MFFRKLFSFTINNPSPTTPHTNNPYFPSKWSPKSLTKECKFEHVNECNFFPAQLPSIFSPLFGLPSASSYYDCLKFLFSGHIPYPDDPKFILMYLQPSYFLDHPSSALVNPPFLRPSGVFTLLEVIPEPSAASTAPIASSQKTDIGLGKIRLSDIVCSTDIDAQFKEFYPVHKDTISFTPSMYFHSNQQYLSQENVMHTRILFHEYIDKKKFIHYGSSPCIISSNMISSNHISSNNRQYVLIHHPMFIQVEGIFFRAYSPRIQNKLKIYSFRLFFCLTDISRNTLSLKTTNFPRPRDSSQDPMMLTHKMEEVTSHHMVSPLLYLNCLSESSLHTLYSFIMVMIQSKNYYSTIVKHDATITVILQNSHFLDRTLFITPDLVINTISKYLKVDLNIIHEGIDRQTPPLNQIRPVYNEFVPDVSGQGSPFSDSPRYGPYNDGFVGLANFALPDITDDMIAAGHRFSNEFCSTFLTPIVEQLFFSSPSSNPNSSIQPIPSNCFQLIHYTTLSHPELSCSKSGLYKYASPIRVPSTIPYPTSLISLYHSLYYNQCYQRQWHLFQPLGIQHLSLRMYTIFLGHESKINQYDKSFRLDHSQDVTFEYLISTKLTTPDDIYKTSNDSAMLQTAIGSTLSKFDHISLPPSLCPLHSKYFNTSRENSTTSTPILALLEPSPATVETINHVGAHLISQLPTELHHSFNKENHTIAKTGFDQNDSKQLDEIFSQPTGTDLSIGTHEDRVQFYKFKYAGEVAGYHNLDYTADIHYFRCPITPSLSSTDSPPFDDTNTLSCPSADVENCITLHDQHESILTSTNKHNSTSFSSSSSKNQLEVRIISPDINYPSRPCRTLPLSHNSNVPSIPTDVLFTLPMNQILALEYYSRHHQLLQSSPLTQKNIESSSLQILSFESEIQPQKEQTISENSKEQIVVQDFNSTNPILISPTSNLLSDNDMTLNTSCETNSTSYYHPTHQSPLSTDQPLTNSFLPLSTATHKYHHVQIHNSFSSTLHRGNFSGSNVNNVFSYPFSCPAIVMLTPYSPYLPFLRFYSADFHHYATSLVQVDINIPFFFVTVVPEQFDITTSIVDLNVNDVPYLGWDSTLPPDKLNSFFAEQQRLQPQPQPQQQSQPQQQQLASDLIIDVHQNLIFQRGRHVKVFSTTIPQDMVEYIKLKDELLQQNSQNNNTSRNGSSDDEIDKQIKLTHSFGRHYSGQLKRIQHFLCELEAQQAKEGKAGGRRSMFHFIVAGMDGYFKALPFINKVALAHYISYRLQPQAD